MCHDLVAAARFGLAADRLTAGRLAARIAATMAAEQSLQLGERTPATAGVAARVAGITARVAGVAAARLRGTAAGLGGTAAGLGLAADRLTASRLTTVGFAARTTTMAVVTTQNAIEQLEGLGVAVAGKQYKTGTQQGKGEKLRFHREGSLWELQKVCSVVCGSTKLGIRIVEDG